MLAHCPELITPGIQINEVVANIDIAPTFLEAAGLRAPEYMDGQSFLPLLQGNQVAWRDGLLYEYYWERNYPQTPTMHALRGDRYKYIHYHGLWDTDEIYDLETDPDESKNLIRSEEHQEIVKQMNRQLFDKLASSGGMFIPLYPDRGQKNDLRYEYGTPGASFPSHLLRNETVKPPGSEPESIH